MPRTVIIAQARMSSTRLPGKTLMDLGGAPVLDRVVARARRARLADDVWLAITTDPSDDVLEEHARSLGVPYVRGSLEDVLARYAQAAEASAADVVVRITCDCPLIDPEVIDTVIREFDDTPGIDYCSNTLVRTYPIGMDTEVFSRAVLEKSHGRATQPHEREHVTPYLYQHPERFRLENVTAPEWARWPELRLTLDEAADLELLQAVVGRVGPDAGLRQVLDALRADPALAQVNAEVEHRHVEKPVEW
ncbi:MAG: glycosyltransferase family protein [Coriobacteriia bacterium]|nr:glycosyltransferase family protein [Coriobacteriia bacterium]